MTDVAKMAVVCILTARGKSFSTFRSNLLLPFVGRVNMLYLVAKVTNGGNLSIKKEGC